MGGSWADEGSWHYWEKCALQSKVESAMLCHRCQVLGRCGVCRYLAVPFLHDAHSASTDPERGNRATARRRLLLERASASTDATLKKVRDDALLRPAAISRHCCGRNSIEDLHNEDRLPGRPCDDRNIFCDATHTALVFKSARDRLQQRQSAVHARWHVSAVASW